MIQNTAFSTENQQNESHHNLDELLIIYREEISAVWVAALKQLPGFTPQISSFEKIKNCSTRLLDSFIDVVTTNSYSQMDKCLSDLYQEFEEAGLDIADSINSLFAFKDAIMAKLRFIICPGSKPIYSACSQLDGLLSHSVIFLAHKYSNTTNLRLQGQQKWTSTLLEIVKTANSSLDVNEVLSNVGEAIRIVTNTPYCGFCLIDEEREQLTTIKMKNEWLDSMGLSEASVEPLPISQINPFLRSAIQSKEPLVCKDAENDPRVATDWVPLNGLKSVLAIPFVFKGQILAIAFAFTVYETQDFSQTQIDLASGIANAVSLAIENARLYSKTKEIAVIEERERLARELHDNLAQSLGALQLKASLAFAYLANARTQQAKDILDEIQDMISEIHSDVRETIFNMRIVLSPKIGFIPTLNEYLTAYNSRYNMEVILIVDDLKNNQLEINETRRTQAMRIIQEALTNVRKHARIKKAAIHINTKEDQVLIAIRDYGCGFDSEKVIGQSGYHLGLQVMHERAESIGGTLEIISGKNKGTSVELSIPLSSNGVIL